MVTSTILRFDADDGLSGWGAVCPIPHYQPAYDDGVAPALGELAPVIFGGDALGVKMCIEDTWGSDITTAATLHLDAATPRRDIINVSVTRRPMLRLASRPTRQSERVPSLRAPMARALVHSG